MQYALTPEAKLLSSEFVSNKVITMAISRNNHIILKQNEVFSE